MCQSKCQSNIYLYRVTHKTGPMAILSHKISTCHRTLFSVTSPNADHLSKFLHLALCSKIGTKSPWKILPHLKHITTLHCEISAIFWLTVADSSGFFAPPSHCEELNSGLTPWLYKNSSEDEIANVNVLRRHRTCGGQGQHPLNWVHNFYYIYASIVIYAPNHLCTYAHHTELSEFVLPK